MSAALPKVSREGTDEEVMWVQKVEIKNGQPRYPSLVRNHLFQYMGA